jgi:hypothetical protein
MAIRNPSYKTSMIPMTEREKVLSERRDMRLEREEIFLHPTYVFKKIKY